MLRDQAPEYALLIGDAAHRVDDAQAEFVDQPIIFVEHLALKNPEAVKGIRAPTHVHARFVKLELHAPGHEAIDRDVDRTAEVAVEVQLRASALHLAAPPGIA